MTTEPNYEYKPVDDLSQYCDELGRIKPEHRDKKFWFKRTDQKDVEVMILGYCPALMVPVIDAEINWYSASILEIFERHEVEPEIEPIPIPDCVPDGWWVYFDADKNWYTDPRKPELWETEMGWCNEEPELETLLDKHLFPELYAWKGPIEKACVQVQREPETEERKPIGRVVEDVFNVLDEKLGDTDPYIDPEFTDDDIRIEHPIFWCCRALSPFVGDNIREVIEPEIKTHPDSVGWWARKTRDDMTIIQVWSIDGKLKWHSAQVTNLQSMSDLVNGQYIKLENPFKGKEC